MTYYTYTTDRPSTDPDENYRLGYRIPRSILLPPYLLGNTKYFSDFMDAVDAVFEPLVDQKIEIIGNLRNMWVTNPTLESTQINNSELIPFEEWSQPERQLLVQQVNALGMKLQSAGVISNNSYQIISRWVGMYWFGKGTQAFIDFINYCLSSALKVTKLWTSDYVNFVPDGDPSIGTPIWNGGTWYPTTHVAIIASGGLQTIDAATLTTFFYEIANYNLVLYSLELSFDIPIVDNVTLTDAAIVAIGAWNDSVIAISNLYRFGVDSPPVYNLNPDLPTGAYSTNPTNTNLSTVYLLSQPTAWVQDSSGNKVPAYTTQDQQVSNSMSLPTTLCGNQNAQLNQNLLILGPVQWLPVPGSSLSDARIPAFSAIPTARTAALSELPTQIVGNLRQNLLSNPTGWTEITPGSGLYTPYW